jgi:hypothetical protein
LAAEGLEAAAHSLHHLQLYLEHAQAGAKIIRGHSQMAYDLRRMGEIVKPVAGPVGPVGFLSEGKLVVNGPGKLELWDISRRPIARDAHWKGGEASVDTAFIVRSGVVGVVADASSWESEPSRPGRIKLLATGTDATIANFEVPGRPSAP